jgi:hypothetical protein
MYPFVSLCDELYFQYLELVGPRNEPLECVSLSLKLSDLCHSCFRLATPPSQKFKMAGAWSENTLVSKGAGRSLRNKTEGSLDENRLISGGAGLSLIIKTSPREQAHNHVFVPQPRQAKSR